MEEEKKQAYSEVVEILKLIDNEEKIEKIPFEVIQLIKGNSDPTYKPEIRKDVPLEDQNLKNETYSIMAWIASKYWGEDVIDEENIKEESIQENNIEEEHKVNNASVYNDIEEEALEGRNLPVLVEHTSWYQRIKSKVILIIKKLFRRKINEEGVKE